MNGNRPKSRWFWRLAAVAVLAAEGFVLVWTQPDRKRWAEVAVLDLRLENGTENPVGSAQPEGGGYRFVDQPERLDSVVEQLSYSEGRCGAFFGLDEAAKTNRALDFFYFEYEPGNPRFIHDVFGHAPEVCMRAIGATLQRQHGDRSVRVDGESIPVRILEFHSPVTSGPLWVMQMIWLPKEAPFQPDDKASTLRREKILSGLFGNPNPPARVLLAGARGYASLDEAWSSYERLLVSRLKIVAP